MTLPGEDSTIHYGKNLQAYSKESSRRKERRRLEFIRAPPVTHNLPFPVLSRCTSSSREHLPSVRTQELSGIK